jgi:hypothetical protein
VAFGEFFSWPSIRERLKTPPAQKAGWLMNLAANWGFRYYYRRRKKRMPDFRDSARWQAAPTA